MSVIKRFRKRQALSATVEIPLKFDGEKFTLTVSRFSEAENTGALQRAYLAAKREEVKNKEDESEVLNVLYFDELFRVLKKHVKGWKHESEEPIPFSKENVDSFFDAMNIDERNLVLGAWNAAMSQDVAENSSGNAPASAEDSPTP